MSSSSGSNSSSHPQAEVAGAAQGLGSAPATAAVAVGEAGDVPSTASSSSGGGSTSSSNGSSSSSSSAAAIPAGGAAAPPPAAFATLPASQAAWLRLVLVSNLPHVEVRVRATPSSPERTLLLMLDTGAGGADVLLNTRGAALLGLPTPQGGDTVVSSLGGGQMNLQRCVLHRLEFGGAVFAPASCCYATEPGFGGLDLSAWTHGILAGGILVRATLVFDYGHLRLAVCMGAADLGLL